MNAVGGRDRPVNCAAVKIDDDWWEVANDARHTLRRVPGPSAGAKIHAANDCTAFVGGVQAILGAEWTAATPIELRRSASFDNPCDVLILAANGARIGVNVRLLTEAAPGGVSFAEPIRAARVALGRGWAVGIGDPLRLVVASLLNGAL